MPDFGIYAGDTNKTIYVRLRDSTTGLAKTGLVYNSAGAVCSYTLPLAARAAITLATQTVTGAHSDGGFVEVDATNCKGLYRVDLSDAAIASGDFTIISIEFDGVIEESIEIPLHTRKVNTTQVGGTTQTARDIGASVLLSSGTGTGQVSLSSGLVTLAAVTHTGAVIPTVTTTTTATNLTNLPAITAGWLTAAGIAASALNGKGDWSTSTALATAQTDLDKITGTDGVTLATAQALYAPSTHNAAAVLTALGNGSWATEAGGTGDQFTGLPIPIYEDGAIWIDTNDGTGGTVVNTNGTKRLPVLTLANAVTLNSTLAFDRFHVAPESAITFTEAHTREIFFADSAIVWLGTQNCDYSIIYGANVGGDHSGYLTLVNCVLGAMTSSGATKLQAVGISTGITLGSAANHLWIHCYSSVAGTGTPFVDFALIGGCDVSIRQYSGGMEFKQMALGDTASIETDGQVVINANCTGGTLVIRGMCSITDNASGAVTITKDGAWNRTEYAADGSTLSAMPWNAAWDAEVESEANDALVALGLDHLLSASVTGTDVVDNSIIAMLVSKSATADWDDYVNTTDAMQAIRDNQGTAQTGDTYELANGAAGFVAIDTVVDAIKVITDALGATAAARLALLAGQIIPATVDTVTNTHTPTTTVFQADDITEATADHYNGRIVIWTSGALTGQATDITDYEAVGGIGQFTVTAMTDAPSNNDTCVIV